MSDTGFNGADLNLLKAFDALERERSVTRAAAAFGLGQPAMSHALTRLRELTGDPLFIRTAGGMEPTPRALELIGPIRLALETIAEALAGERPFDANADALVTLGLSDYIAGAIVPKLLTSLRTLAPNMNVAVKAADRRNAEQMLDAREIDLAVGLLPHAAPWHRRQALFMEDHVCVFNPKLVDIGAHVTAEDYQRLPHVLVSLAGDPHGFVDDILARAGAARRIWATIPFFLLSGDLLEATPAIATLPRTLAEYCSRLSRLEMRELPFKTPGFEVSMLWHLRDERDAKLALVRRAVLDVCKSFT